jgi:hypothetical protein
MVTKNENDISLFWRIISFLLGLFVLVLAYISFLFFWAIKFWPGRLPEFRKSSAVIKS